MSTPTSQNFDELELVAEKTGELNDRVGKIEHELGTQTKTLESAALVLDAAIKGLGALKSSVLENDLAALQLALNEKTAHLEREIGRFEMAVAEIDRRAESGDDEIKSALLAAAQSLRTQFDTHASDVSKWSQKVEQTIAEHSVALAAIPAVIKGADAKTFNPRGEWAAGMVTNLLDVVSYAGSSYVSNEDGNTEKPSKSKRYTVLAKRAGGLAITGGGDTQVNVATLAGTAAGLTAGNTLAVPAALTGVNSVTSAAASNLTLGTGTFGTALTFTSATGGATFAGTTATTSTTTGSLINNGGFGNAGAAFFGGLLTSTASGNNSFGGTVGNNSITVSRTGVNASSIGLYAFTDLPALDYSGTTNLLRINAAGTERFRLSPNFNLLIGTTTDVASSSGLVIAGTGASTSTTTGSLINSGGFGNAGAAFIGGTIAQGGATISTNQAASFRLGVGPTFSIFSNAAADMAGTGGISVNTYGSAKWTGFSAGGAGQGIWGTSLDGSMRVAASGGSAVFFGEMSNLPFTNAVSTFTEYGRIGSTQMVLNGTTSASSSTTGALLIGNGTAATNVGIGGGNIVAGAQIRSTSATGGIGYATGAGGTVTQITSRTTGVTLNTIAGAITLFTAAGSATWQSFTVTNSTVAATDTIIVNQRSGTDLYMMHVTAVGAGSFRISFATTGGTTSEAPVFNFAVIKAVSS